MPRTRGHKRNECAAPFFEHCARIEARKKRACAKVETGVCVICLLGRWCGRRLALKRRSSALV